MIGNQKWFNVRKYTGWGLTPNCWQGWLYIAVFVIPFIIMDSVSINQPFKNIFTSLWIALFLIDIFHMLTQIRRDERERLHEAIADRNALWFMIFALIVWAFFKQSIDPIFIVVLLGATVIKAGTQFYLRDK